MTPYRDSDLHLFCAACDAQAEHACSRCGVPACDAHRRETGRCRSCDATIQAAIDEVRIFGRPNVGLAVTYPLIYVCVMAACAAPTLGLLSVAAIGAAFAGIGAAFVSDAWRLRRRMSRARALASTPTRQLTAGS